MDARDRTIAKLQRSAARRGEHLLGVMEKNDSLRHEVQRLQKALLACYFQPDHVAAIVGRVIPKHLRAARARAERTRAGGN